MPSEVRMQQKIKVITKLAESGYDTEKKLQKLEMENILQIKGITIPEMSIILALQKSTKSGKLYSYLCGGEDEVDKQGENNG